MSCYIVPSALSDAINEEIDKAILELPEADRPVAEAERQNLYGQLLGYFNEYGMIPGFSLRRKQEGDDAGPR
jgi:hypothetical protein